jgi:4-hydroxybenzoate polyprenyltransferase
VISEIAKKALNPCNVRITVVCEGEVSMLVPTVFEILHWFKPYFEVCRVESWLSWVFGFALGTVFFILPLLDRAVTVFFAFSFATASIFVLNQYFDRQADEKNKTKSNLPIASGRVSPHNALIFSFLLVISCFTLVFIADTHLSPSFFLYLALWTLYSAPYPRLKAIPIIDFLASGVGAGFLPFFIGLSATHQPNISISLVILTTISLTLFHCGAHIIQTIGDYEADREAGVNTFVAKYGKKKGVTVSGLMFLSSFLSPFTGLFAGLVSPSHLIFLFTLLPFSIHPLLRFKHLYENPYSSNVISLQKSVKKYGILALLIAWVYVLTTKFVLTGL